MKKLLTSYKSIVFIFLIIFLILFFIFFLEIGKYKKVERLVVKYSKEYSVDENLVLAILKTESNFNKNALSKKGAIGIAQILPSTADYIAKILGYSESYNLFDEDVSVRFATFYLSYLNKKFSSELEVICAYNAGEGRVEGWINDLSLNAKNIPFKETKVYYKKVIRRKNLYRIIR